MKRIVGVFFAMLSALTAHAAVTTHLDLDTRTGLREVSVEGEVLHYDADWYQGGVVARVEDNGTLIAAGSKGVCNLIEADGVHVVQLVVFDDKGAIVGTASAELVVPEVVDGCRIGDGWVLGYEGTVPERLVIPEGVRGIVAGAFREEFWLEELVLPDSLQVIDAEAFWGCTELRSISFGTGLKRVGDAAFKDCISLEAVEFPEGLEYLGAEAFATEMDSMRLKSVSLPASLREIGAGAFARCALLTGVTAPTGVLPCSQLFPASYQKLESFVVPAGVTNVVAEMFKGCELLTNIELAESLQEIGDSAFAGCQSLREIGLPDGVTRLGLAAFSDCMNLRTVGLSKGLLAIEDRTFEKCPMLDSLIVPENVARIGANIYSGGTYYSLDRNPDGLYYYIGRTETRLGVNGYWYEYRNVNRLTAIYFLGNAPTVETTTYANMPSELKSYVIKGSTGWYREGAPTLPVGGWPTSGNAREITYWQPNVFDVIFDANGGTPATYTAQEITDTTYALPKVPPTRTGYLFDGWWTEKTAGARVTANSRVTANKTHTLYAHWQSRSDVVIVNFNPNGGTVDPMEVVYPLDVTFGVLPVPTRIGHTFLGWFTSQVGGTRVTESSSVSKENNELYAHWQPIAYTVRFHANGGTGAAYEQTFTYNVPAALTTCRFTLTGFSFTGWSVTPGGEVNFANGATVENLGELQGQVVDLYAVWNAAGYAVRFDGNGGAGSMANQTLLVGASQALSANAFTRQGYVFAGWATTATGSVVYQDGETVKNLSLQNGTTVVLYAVWTPGSYSVRYSANGGTGRTVKNTVLWDQSYTIVSNPYAYEHHTFLGWAQSETGSVVYNPGENVRNLAAEIGDEVVLYAVWQEIHEENLPEPGDLLGTDKFGDLAYEATDWQVVACDEPTVGTACLMAAPEEVYDETESETAFVAQVRGAGTVRFFWKTSCDADPDGAYTWDRAEFRVDGETVARCDGITDWEEVVYPIADAGIHSLAWVYCMDGYPAELSGVEDRAWVGGIAWSGADYEAEIKPLVEPVIDPADGATFSDESCTVTITCSTTDATIYYSTNGRTPSATETYRYTGPFAITKTTTVKAVAVRGTEKSAYVTVVITKVDPPAPKEFAISYVGLEGAMHANPATYHEGEALIFAAPSVREGYTFVGWTPAAITPEMTGDVVVTANWKPIGPRVISINFSDREAYTMSMLDGFDGSLAGTNILAASWNDYSTAATNDAQVVRMWDGREVVPLENVQLSYASGGWIHTPHSYAYSSSSPFLNKYLDDMQGASVSVLINNVPFERYDVIVYYQGDTSSHRFKPICVNGVWYSSVDGETIRVADFAKKPIWGIPNQPQLSLGVNAIRVNGVVGSDLDVVPGGYESIDGVLCRSTIAALQIVEAEGEYRVESCSDVTSASAAEALPDADEYNLVLADGAAFEVDCALTRHYNIVCDGSVNLVGDDALKFAALEKLHFAGVTGEVVIHTTTDVSVENVCATFAYVVDGGTLKLSGVAPARIQVNVGGTFDVNGVADVSYPIYLNGGTLANGGAAIGERKMQWWEVSLLADSFVDAQSEFGMIAPRYAAFDFHSNGHRLVKRGAGILRLANVTFVGGCTLVIEEGYVIDYKGMGRYENVVGELAGGKMSLGGTLNSKGRFVATKGNSFLHWESEQSNSICSDDTRDDPFVRVNKGAELRIDGKDFSGWLGGLTEHGWFANEGTLRFTTGTGTRFFRDHLLLGDGSSVKIDHGSTPLLLYGGAGTEESCQIMVPSGTAVIASGETGTNARINLGSSGSYGTKGAGVSVGADAILTVEVPIDGSDVLTKWGDGRLICTQAVTCPVVLAGGTIAVRPENVAREGQITSGRPNAKIVSSVDGGYVVYRLMEDATVGKEVTGLEESVTVPASWVLETLVDRYGAGKDVAFVTMYGSLLVEALAKASGKVNVDGRALTVWDDYVAGTDPTDPTSVFAATIEMVDGLPKVTWSPDLGAERVYTVLGSTDLKEWTKATEETKGSYKFFKVAVEMP